MVCSFFRIFRPVIKKEDLMVSVDFNEEKHNALVGLLMIVLAIVFLLYMVSSLVDATHGLYF